MKTLQKTASLESGRSALSIKLSPNKNAKCGTTYVWSAYELINVFEKGYHLQIKCDF
jgi:hypothetical protein